MRPLPELLSPAGDENALRAAVDCGADAVYLGCKAFGARASAANFDDQALGRAVQYAHLYHVRVHVTVNTLVKENEWADVIQTLRSVAEAGADAVIVQDLGVARLVRERFPSLLLHASTQMALSNASDARFAMGQGFSRVVLARECSLDGIRQVAETGVETEVFAHGALCAGVSGRCLLSSMAGGRSGNRGRCAQPCRQQASLNGREGALLSLRDLCTLEYLPALIDAGVTALKIEGRLKSEEYVAVVTETYRRALDGIRAGTFDPRDPAPKEKLMQIFNRGGFTRGHALGAQDAELAFPGRTGHEGVPLGEIAQVKGQLATLRTYKPLHDGDSLQIRDRQDVDLRYAGRDAEAGETATLRLRPEARVQAGSPVARLCDARQLEAARAHAPKPIPITMSASFRAGQPMELTASDGESAVTVTGDAAQTARTRASTAEEVCRNLCKLGDTPFVLSTPESLSLCLEDGLFLPVSALNALRRDGLDRLRLERIRAFARRNQCREVLSLAPTEKKPRPFFPVSAETLAVSFSEPELAQSLADCGATLLLYQPRSYCVSELEKALATLPPGVWLVLPPQSGEDALQAVRELIMGSNLGGVVANSLGQVALFPSLPVLLGESIPVSNREALAALAETPACAFTLWPEWTYAEQREIAPFSMPALLKVYGRERLMLLNHCPERVARGLSARRADCALCADFSMACGQPNAELTDRKGYRFPLTRTAFPEGCALSLWNALPTDLRAWDGERRALGAGMLLSFTTEAPEEQLALTRLFAALLRGESVPSAENATAGHWKRGVE